jgi:putative ABC transport system permease protein
MAKLMNLLPWRRRRLEQDLGRELQYHFERRVEDLRNEGRNDAEARRLATVEFGGIVAIQEEVRETWTWRWLENVSRDIQYAARTLRRNHGFAAVAVLILALPIAASSVVFSLINTVLLQPRAGRIDSLVSVFSRDRQRPDSYRDFSYPLYVDLRDRSAIFESVMAHTVALVGIQEGGATRRSLVEIVSSNYFSTLGVRLVAGRSFSPEEEHPGARPVVTIASYSTWRQHGFDPEFIGSQVRVNGTLFTVIGVAPPELRTTVLISPDWYFPLGADERLINQWFHEGPGRVDDRANHAFFVAGALKPDVLPTAAEQRLEVLSAQLGQAFPGTDRDRAFVLREMSRLGLSSEPQRAGPIDFIAGLLILMSAMVLGVACLNLANLMLARGAARRREIGIRQAIGGGRVRIVGQLLIEGLTLSLIGAMAGILLAWWGHRALTAWITRVVGMVALDGVNFTVALSWRMVVVASGLAVLSALCFALGPAWRLTGPSVTSDLRGEPDILQRFGSGKSLVGLQLAVSLALLAAGSLFVRSAIAAAGASPGFALERLLVFSLDPSLGAYDEGQTRALYRDVLDHVRSIPGVEHSSLASKVAFGEFVENGTVTSRDQDAHNVTAGFTIVTSEYFATLRLPILRGRGFSVDEDQRTPPVVPAVISASLVQQLFPSGDPLGQQVTVRRGNSEAMDTVMVVGVVPGTTQDILDSESQSQIYLPYGARFRAPMVLHVGLDGRTDETTMLKAVQSELRRLDGQLPILTARTMKAQRDASIPRWAIRVAATAFGLFGCVALLIATLGVYGLQTYDVERRTRELGIRLALGATNWEIKALILRQGLKTAGVALFAGLLLAIGIGRLFSGLLYRVSPLDPVALIVAALALSITTLVACYLPARRATRLATVDALRVD